MKKNPLTLTLLFCLALIISGCASSPKKISSAYVSPLIYKDYDCDQIALEMEHVSRRTTDLYYSLRKESRADGWQMGIGLLVFWPSLFLLEGGDGPEASEYARLKGTYEALRTVAVQKKCSLEILPPSPEELIKLEDDKNKKTKRKKSSDK